MRPKWAAIIAAAGVLVIAGAALGLSSLLGSTQPHPAPSGRAAAAPAPSPTVPAPATATTPSTVTSPTTVVPFRQVKWLGMQIATQPPDIAVVQTVAIGTPADQAGINPGDVIVAVNGRAIRGAEDIASALRGLTPGERVTVELAYGSGTSQAELTLGAPPSVQP